MGTEELISCDQLLTMLAGGSVEFTESNSQRSIYTLRCGCVATRPAHSSNATIRPCAMHRRALAAEQQVSGKD